MISHGEMKQHIWAYVTGEKRIPTNDRITYCPCAAGAQFIGVVPSFIGNDYYCDSGSDNDTSYTTFYTHPLWEDKGCSSTNFCCSNSGMPWFCKTLLVPTVDDIEVRNCINSPSSVEDTPVSLIELYVR